LAVKKKPSAMSTAVAVRGGRALRPVHGASRLHLRPVEDGYVHLSWDGVPMRAAGAAVRHLVHEFDAVREQELERLRAQLSANARMISLSL
jgi:hypothetical protein